MSQDAQLRLVALVPDRDQGIFSAARQHPSTLISGWASLHLTLVHSTKYERGEGCWKPQPGQKCILHSVYEYFSVIAWAANTSRRPPLSESLDDDLWQP